MTELQKTENYARELTFILFNQKRVILWTAVLVYFLVLLVAFFWPPVYSASGSLLVKGKTLSRDPQSLETGVVRQPTITEEDLNSEVQIFRSDDVVRQTVRLLETEAGIFKEDESTIKKLVSSIVKPLKKLLSRDVQQPPGVDAQTLARMEEIRKSLTVRVVPTSNVISVRLSWADPFASQRLLDTLMRSYLVQRRSVFEPSQMRDFFGVQVEGYTRQLEHKKNQIIELLKRGDTPDPGAALENNLVLRRSISEQLNSLETQKIELQSQFQLINDALNDRNIRYFAFIENEMIRSLASEVQALASEHARALRSYEPQSETVVALEHQLATARSNLNREVRALLEGLGARLIALESQAELLNAKIRDIDARNVELKQLQLEVESLQREAELLEFSYETFYKRSEEASIGSRQIPGGADSQVVVLTEAQAFPEPDFPRTRPLIVFGLLLSFLVGGTVGFVREFFDHTFNRPEDVERITGLPVIFSIGEGSK